MEALKYTTPDFISYITDETGLLSAQIKDRIEKDIQSLNMLLNIELAVYITPSIGNIDIGPYVNSMYLDWSLGANCNNRGMLLFISLKQKQMRLQIGDGLFLAFTVKDKDTLMNRLVLPLRDYRVEESIRTFIAWLVETYHFHLGLPKAFCKIFNVSYYNPRIGAFSSHLSEGLKFYGKLVAVAALTMFVITTVQSLIPLF